MSIAQHNARSYSVLKIMTPRSSSLWMLQNFDIDGETTMAAPGSGFYAEPGKGMDEVRMAYVLKKEDLQKALHILKNAIAAY